MAQFNVHQAKTCLSQLLAQAEAGEDVVIARRGEPVVRLVLCKSHVKRRFGAMKDQIHIDDDFFDVLPEDELDAWGSDDTAPRIW